jgi:hypothetical protein
MTYFTHPRGAGVWPEHSGPRANAGLPSLRSLPNNVGRGASRHLFLAHLYEKAEISLSIDSTILGGDSHIFQSALE